MELAEKVNIDTASESIASVGPAASLAAEADNSSSDFSSHPSLVSSTADDSSHDRADACILNDESEAEGTALSRVRAL